MKKCKMCSGTGTSRVGNRTCYSCNGAKTCKYCNGLGLDVCSICKGAGETKCRTCYGEGMEKCPECSGGHCRKCRIHCKDKKGTCRACDGTGCGECENGITICPTCKGVGEGYKKLFGGFTPITAKKF